MAYRASSTFSLSQKSHILYFWKHIRGQRTFEFADDPTMTLLPQATPTNRSTSQSAAVMGMQSLMRYPPSPTSTNDTEAETEAELFFPDGQDEYEFAYGGAAYYGGNAQQGLGCGFRNADAVRELQTLQMMQACGYTLSSNPPKARTGSGFRHGDWM